MKHYKELVINNRKFTVNHYMADVGLDLGSDLIQVLGVPMATLFAKGKKGAAGEMLPYFIESLSGKMRDVRVSQLVKSLLCTTTYEGQILGNMPGEPDGSFNLIFQGRLGDVFKLLTEVVRFQFEDFFSVAIAAGLKQMAEEDTVSKAQTSNG